VGVSSAAESETGTAERVAVRVTKDAQRQIRGGHPWVFDASVTSVRPGGRAGDLAVVFDDRRNFMAIGLLDPDSPIRIRILHHGRPTPIDGDFWLDRLRAALERRSPLEDDPGTNAYRWVHGENDGLPGLVLDRYGPIVVIKVYSAAWLPHLSQLLEAIGTAVAPDAVVLRLARNVPGSAANFDGQVLVGELAPEPVQFLEGGLRFEADVRLGQKTGHFLDQRDNRKRIRAESNGARVLDVYACTGGFSVNAAAGGARLVHMVDVSAGALASARRNMDLNRSLKLVNRCQERDTVGDAMDVMAGLAASGQRFDIVIVDPPAFASRQEHLERALRSYGRLTEAAVRLIEPGGLLVQVSCSARVGSDEFFGTVQAAATRSGVALTEPARTGHGLDHPIGFPQGAYLKALFARVEPRG
jgi:23S rRNA (cytosine1962-C5)-methyltransferase